MKSVLRSIHPSDLYPSFIPHKGTHETCFNEQLKHLSLSIQLSLNNMLSFNAFNWSANSQGIYNAHHTFIFYPVPSTSGKILLIDSLSVFSCLPEADLPCQDYHLPKWQLRVHYKKFLALSSITISCACFVFILCLLPFNKAPSQTSKVVYHSYNTFKPIFTVTFISIIFYFAQEVFRSLTLHLYMGIFPLN